LIVLYSGLFSTQPQLKDIYPQRLVSINLIIAENLAVGVAFSRASRLQGAPARPDQKFTSGEIRKQHEIAIASCNSWGEWIVGS
jgi:hypothetical protein